MERLPNATPFLPAQLKWRIADSSLEGVDGFGIAPTTVTTDGGGYWVAEFKSMRGATDAHHRSLRGQASRLRGGKRIIVPFIEKSPSGGLGLAGFDDGTTYDDGTVETVGLISAELEEAVSLRADTALIRVTAGPNLRGSDIFSVMRTDGRGEEMHLCDDMVEVEPRLWAVTIGPQFRSAHPAGAALNFNDPGCTMRLVDPEGEFWPTADRGWIHRPSARFVEAVR